jgi:hypothetical protein
MPVDTARHGEELAVSSIRPQDATVMLVGIATSGVANNSDAAGSGPPAGGFGVTRGRHVERAAKTPW